MVEHILNARYEAGRQKIILSRRRQETHGLRRSLFPVERLGKVYIPYIHMHCTECLDIILYR
jgi:hypothetical protein